MRRRAAGCILIAAALWAASAVPGQAEKKVDAYGEYHAALGVQTDSYRRVFRDAYFDGSAEEEKDFTKLRRERTQGGGADGAEKLQGTFRDVTIRGNGTYTVTLKNADFCGQRRFRKLYVATDIPNTEEITFSNMSVSIGGRVLRTFDEPVLDVSKTYRKNAVLLAIHPVNEDVKGEISTWTVPRYRNNVIKIRFTVDGFDYDKGETPETPSPEPSETPEAPEVTEAPVREREHEAVPESSRAPRVESGNSSEGLPLENKIGIVATIAVAIGGVLVCLGVVTRRNR